MLFTAAEIGGWVGGYLWPLVRIGAMLMAAPLFGSRALPRRARLMLALVLTWVALPLLPETPAIDPLSPDGVLVTVQQVLIGVSMGFALTLVFSALQLGGQVIAVQMGLGFANLVDPGAGGQTPLLSHLYNLLGGLIFLSLDGHLLLMQLVVESFQTLPVGAAPVAAEAWRTLAGWGAQMFAGAVLVALPAIASLTLVNLAFGVMSRAAPQLNIFAVGFPITLLMGMVILMFSLPGLGLQFPRMLDGAFGLLGTLTGLSAEG